jgi:hypothetical protein
VLLRSFVRGAAIVGNMNELDESLFQQTLMSNRQILQRFKKLLGREMTIADQRIFFLPYEDPLSRKENPRSSDVEAPK